MDIFCEIPQLWQNAWFCKGGQKFNSKPLDIKRRAISTIRVLNGPENYDPTRHSPRVFKPEPDAARPPAPALFSSYTCYHNFTQRRQVCVCPSPLSSSETYSSPHVNGDDSQENIIYNLQEMGFMKCVFLKKGSPRPDPTRLICVFFWPELIENSIHH